MWTVDAVYNDRVHGFTRTELGQMYTTDEAAFSVVKIWSHNDQRSEYHAFKNRSLVFRMKGGKLLWHVSGLKQE